MMMYMTRQTLWVSVSSFYIHHKITPVLLAPSFARPLPPTRFLRSHINHTSSLPQTYNHVHPSLTSLYRPFSVSLQVMPKSPSPLSHSLSHLQSPSSLAPTSPHLGYYFLFLLPHHPPRSFSLTYMNTLTLPLPSRSHFFGIPFLVFLNILCNKCLSQENGRALDKMIRWIFSYIYFFCREVSDEIKYKSCM